MSPPSDTRADVAERLERERTFHDEAFAAHTRQRTDKFYAVAKEAWQAYEGAILRQAKGIDVLEYGCGPGSFATVLASHGSRVVGIDISEVAIAQASADAPRHGFGNALAFRVMNAEQLEFGDSCFDRICGQAILHHLDLARALPELARVLRPNGNAVFLEALGHNPLINWYRRRTPTLRTEDEHPLRKTDLDGLRRHFDKVEIEYFCLTVLAAAPLAGRPGFGPIRSALANFDSLIFRMVPPARINAWMALIRLAQPRKA